MFLITTSRAPPACPKIIYWKRSPKVLEGNGLYVNHLLKSKRVIIAPYGNGKYQILMHFVICLYLILSLSHLTILVENTLSPPSNILKLVCLAKRVGWILDNENVQAVRNCKKKSLLLSYLFCYSVCALVFHPLLKSLQFVILWSIAWATGSVSW